MAKQHEALQSRVHHPRGANFRGLIIKPIQKGRELRLAERAQESTHAEQLHSGDQSCCRVWRIPADTLPGLKLCDLVRSGLAGEVFTSSILRAKMIICSLKPAWVITVDTMLMFRKLFKTWLRKLSHLGHSFWFLF